MANDHAVLVGLLDWLNSLQVAEEVHTAEDISDGQVVWKVLRMTRVLLRLHCY
jgi:hypothetical protein